VAHIIADRVLETSTTTGTGALTLAGAITGYRAFSAVCATSDTVDYAIFAVDTNGVPTGDWEVGVGTYSAASTLTRTTVKASSNTGSAVSFAAGTKRVGISVIAATLPGKGAAFPGSPATGDKFYRTDRHIEYFYDGTRWLSTQLFTGDVQTTETVQPIAVTATLRMANPWWNLYDIYVERFVVTYFNNSTTASNYYVTQLYARDGVGSTALGSGLSGQNDTQSSYIAHSETIDTVVDKATDAFTALEAKTRTSTCYVQNSFTYRLVG